MAGEVTNQSKTRKSGEADPADRTHKPGNPNSRPIELDEPEWTDFEIVPKHGLQQIANHVNEQLQPAFNRLAELKPELPDWHQTAIDHMRTSAANLALNADAAIRSRDPDGSGQLAVSDPDYKQYVANIHERATVLAQVADATGDYGTAQLKGHQAGLAISSHD